MIRKSPRPAVAVTVTDSETPERIRKAISGTHRVSLFLEIRIDRFRRMDEAYLLQKIRLLRRLGLPLIATIRSKKEGGGRSLSDARRITLFKKVLPLVHTIDLEFSSKGLSRTLIPLAKRRGKRVILSCHNFHSTPREAALGRFVQKAKRAGADWVKIAVTPKTKAEVARLLLFTHRNREKNLIVIGMGRLGAPTRTLAPIFGSLLTYSFLHRPQAPGQISFRRLSKELNAFLGKP